MTPERLYGVRDIAEALGVPRGTVAQWHHRGKLPAADAEVSGMPVWYARTVELWIASQKQEAPPVT